MFIAMLEFVIFSLSPSLSLLRRPTYYQKARLLSKSMFVNDDNEILRFCGFATFLRTFHKKVILLKAHERLKKEQPFKL